jgi:hypothetical protein
MNRWKIGIVTLALLLSSVTRVEARACGDEAPMVIPEPKVRITYTKHHSRLQGIRNFVGLMFQPMDANTAINSLGSKMNANLFGQQMYGRNWQLAWHLLLRIVSAAGLVERQPEVLNHRRC